jgi:pectin methylesterase-like acyl-CoA thioesterase
MSVIRSTSFALIAFVFCIASAFAQPTSQPFIPAKYFPAYSAKDVCPDTPLRIEFPSAPVVGTGKIQIVDSADNSVVDTIDVATSTSTKSIGGLPNFKYYPIIITGNEAALYLSPGALKYNKSYSVKLDPGAFKDAAGNPITDVSDSAIWNFKTKSTPPKSGSTKVTVAADGTGDFATVQAALDFIPDGNTTPATIFIRNGTYNEIVCVMNKNAITLLGEDRKKTIIAYANNDRFNNNSGGNPFAATAPVPAAAKRTGAIYRRGMLLAHHCNDLTIANLTLHNTTPHGGSQAEAIIANGSQDAHLILANVDLYSFQDTLQINGQAYISNCYIEGDVDFMWGTGPCFFDNCHAKSVHSKAYYTQIRNPASNHGFIYNNCTFDGSDGVTENYLSRIDPARFPASEVVLMNCTMTEAVGAVAWQLQHSQDPANVHYWEYNSHTPDGKPVDDSKRLDLSRRLKLPDDKETIDNYTDPKFVLGGQWTPTIPPEIVSQPHTEKP